MPQKESVVQTVVDSLTQKLINKELKPGDKLPPEPELAQQMGVARSSVREAIKILSYLGVLESKRAEGTKVRNGFTETMIDPMIYGIILNQDEENLMELREMTETGIMRLAISKYKPEDGKVLEDLLQGMKKVLSQGSGIEVADGFFEIDNKFHDEIARLGKNPMADKISRVVRMLTYALRYETVKAMIAENRGDELLQAHVELNNMLKEGQLDGIGEKVQDTYFKDVLKKEENI